MKDIELPPLPVGILSPIGELYTPEQMDAYASAAVEADRAQRVPDGYSEDQIAQPAPQPEQRKPMTREQVKGLMKSAGYDMAKPQEWADFINGIRHAERHHGIRE